MNRVSCCQTDTDQYSLFLSLRLTMVPPDVSSQASRAQILKKAAEYIQSMRRKNTSHQQDIEDLRKQNKVLEEQSEFFKMEETEEEREEKEEEERKSLSESIPFPLTDPFA